MNRLSTFIKRYASERIDNLYLNTVEFVLSHTALKLEESVLVGDLLHHGVKGQKWGVRNGPPYPVKKQNAKTSSESAGLKTPEIVAYPKNYKEIHSHGNAGRVDKPGMIVDKLSKDGDKVVVRTFYDDNGIKSVDLHLTDHGKPVSHPYGKHGEHAHDYTWFKDSNGEWTSTKTIREITDDERKENDDIL